QIVSDYPHDSASGLAAFTIGRIRLHDLKQYNAAADGFSLAIRLGLPAGLREQAYAKQVEALSHTDDSRRLRAAADSYNQHYPKGIWKEWVERWSKSR
ncbi:MAG: hypothetical protein JXX14_23830, partial [Deltaproteobacteria bacterium]|nr:hypothetical protein [Deltaproteobacteria bacterium]